MAKDGAYFITDSLAQHMPPVEALGKKSSVAAAAVTRAYRSQSRAVGVLGAKFGSFCLPDERRRHDGARFFDHPV
jgi:hypothetical protein